MCGICGEIALKRQGLDNRRVDQMLSKLLHRGPDAQQTAKFQHASLGHSRLSIIDLSSKANQPMESQDKNHCIVFNGEIYNYQALRKELISLGAKFITESDTEVLLHGYKIWGMDKLLDKCDGMWAFCLYDKKTHTTYLARDRFGEKPLFYTIINNILYFSSTLQSLMTCPIDKKLNESALIDYFHTLYIPTDTSIFKNVNKVLPAHYLKINETGIQTKPYWQLEYSTQTQSLDDALNGLKHHFQQAVSSRMIADVPVGAFLSGGLDSSMVVAQLTQHQQRPITFTMRAPGTHRDEGHYAKLVADKFQTKHIEIPLDPSCVSILPELIAQVGEPFADSSIIPAQFVCAEINKHVKVVLGGDGGDELFGGYRSVQYLQYLSKLKPYFLPFSVFLGQRSFQHGDSRWAKFKRMLIFAGNFEAYLSHEQLFGAPYLKSLFCEEFYQNAMTSYVHPNIRALKLGKAELPFQQRLLAGFYARLAGDFMVKVDSAAMFNSIEARNPFLSRGLVEFAVGLAPSFIHKNGHDKYLFKLFAKEHLPPAIIDRQKAGFSIPIQKWINDYWQANIKKTLSKSILIELGIISPKGMEALLDPKGLWGSKRATAIYLTFVLELWARNVFDEPLTYDI